MKKPRSEHSCLFATALIITGSLVFVNSPASSGVAGKGSVSAQADSGGKAQNLAWKELIRKLLDQGFEEDVLGNISKGNLDIPTDLSTRGDDAAARDMEDLMDNRICVLVLKMDKDAEVPLNVVFSVRKKSEGKSETYFFKATLEGKPEKAFLQRGKYDEKGKPVRGSAVITQLDVKSPDVRKRLKRELDFWLHGKGRKKAEPEKAPESGAKQ